MFFRRPGPRGIGVFLAAVFFAISPSVSAQAQSLPGHVAAIPSFLLFRTSPLGACLPLAEAIAAAEGSAGIPDERLSPCALTPPDAMHHRTVCRETSLGVYSCSDAEAEFRAAMLAKGKRGEAVLQARAAALQILRGENACSAWFREKDPEIADTFETLNYEIDSKAVNYVAETPASELRVYSSPYVATVVQGGGAHQTVTLNAAGAFFRRSAYIRVFQTDGGSGRFSGARYLRVGPYTGDTHEAQVTTLLHELGHVIDLLPMDQGDVDGKSVHNTDIVLQHCRSEVTEATHGMLKAQR